MKKRVGLRLQIPDSDSRRGFGSSGPGVSCSGRGQAFYARFSHWHHEIG
jgi:hypothetical protein